MPGAAGPRIAVVEDGRLREADERDEAAEEAVRLVQAQDFVDRAAAHQPEIPGIGWDLDLRDALDHAVAERGDEALGERLALARAALAVDDVEALAPARDHVAEKLRRILHVGIDHDDGVARGHAQTGHRGGGLAEATRQPDQLDARVRRPQLADHVFRAVGRRVDAEDELEVDAGLLERGPEALVQRTDVVLLVQARNDDRDDLAGHHSAFAGWALKTQPRRATNENAAKRTGTTSATRSSGRPACFARASRSAVHPYEAKATTR